jgi:hypothetical protein
VRLVQAARCVAVLALATACAQSPGAALSTAPPGRYLLTIDELQTADFVVSEGEHPVGPDWLSRAASTDVKTAGFQVGAEVMFLRPVGALSLSNGPTDVRATVVRFIDADAAQRALAAEVAGLDGRPGAQAISTGPLGDAAHAISEVATLQGVEVVQITVVWRARNLVNSIVLHGRYGGARLDDALALAHKQNQNELNGGPPLPTSSATPTPRGSPSPGATASAHP